MTDPTPNSKRSPLEHERDLADGFTTAEFLLSCCRDIVTGAPLHNDARPDLYVRDVRVLAEAYAALEARIAELEATLRRIVSVSECMSAEYIKGVGEGGHAYTARVARAALGEKNENDLVKRADAAHLAERNIEDMLREWKEREYKARDKDRIRELEYENAVLLAMLDAVTEAAPAQPGLLQQRMAETSKKRKPAMPKWNWQDELAQQRAANERMRECLRQARRDAEEAQNAIAGILDVINDAIEDQPNQGDDEC